MLLFFLISAVKGEKGDRGPPGTLDIPGLFPKGSKFPAFSALTSSEQDIVFLLQVTGQTLTSTL